MSQENVEIMRQGTEAFDRRDKEAWLATLDPDAVMIPARQWPEQAPIRGAAAIWDFYIEVVSAWEEGWFELAEIIETRDDTLVSNVRHEARGKTSGAAVPFDYW